MASKTTVDMIPGDENSAAMIPTDGKTHVYQLDDIAPATPIIPKDQLMKLSEFYLTGGRSHEGEYGIAAIFTVEATELEEPHQFIVSVVDNAGNTNQQRQKLLRFFETNQDQDVMVGPMKAVERGGKFGKPALVFQKVEQPI